MKKIITIFCLLLLFVACSNGNSSNVTTSPSNVDSSSNEEKVFSEKDFSIEEVSIKDYSPSSFWHSKVKIRNNSDHYINNIEISYQILDKNGDVLDDGNYYASDLEAGQSIIVEDQTTRSDGDFSKVASYKFTKFEVREYDDIKIWEKTRFTTPIIVERSDFTTYK